MGAEGGPEGVERAGRGGDDGRLWEAFQELVEARGRTAAADALGVNYRTVVANLEADRLSRRMRTAVQRFESQESEPGPAGSPEAGEPGEAEERGETMGVQPATAICAIKRNVDRQQTPDTI